MSNCFLMLLIPFSYPIFRYCNPMLVLILKYPPPLLYQVSFIKIYKFCEVAYFPRPKFGMKTMTHSTRDSEIPLVYTP
jgi:hypothetical protein